MSDENEVNTLMVIWYIEIKIFLSSIQRDVVVKGLRDSLKLIFTNGLFLSERQIQI